jgi:hypothetical protein
MIPDQNSDTVMANEGNHARHVNDVEYKIDCLIQENIDLRSQLGKKNHRKQRTGSSVAKIVG